MDLVKCLEANRKIQRKKFEEVFELFDHTFSDCEVVDLNKLFHDSGLSDISRKKSVSSTQSSYVSKIKKMRRKFVKKFAFGNCKKIAKRRTKSIVSKKKGSTSRKHNATQNVASKLEIAPKSNEHLKDISQSPLKKNCHTVAGWGASSNKSIFCEPPTIIDLYCSNASGDEDDHINCSVNTNLEIDANGSEFCNPPTIIEENYSIERSGYCTPPTMIEEKCDVNKYSPLDNEIQSDLWYEHFEKCFPTDQQSDKTEHQRISKSFLKWHLYFAHMFPN